MHSRTTDPDELRKVMKRVKRANYVLNSGAVSPFMNLESVESAEQANELVKRILER